MPRVSSWFVLDWLCYGSWSQWCMLPMFLLSLLKLWSLQNVVLTTEVLMIHVFLIWFFLWMSQLKSSQILCVILEWSLLLHHLMLHSGVFVIRCALGRGSCASTRKGTQPFLCLQNSLSFWFTRWQSLAETWQTSDPTAGSGRSRFSHQLCHAPGCCPPAVAAGDSVLPQAHLL